MKLVENMSETKQSKCKIYYHYDYKVLVNNMLYYSLKLFAQCFKEHII